MCSHMLKTCGAYVRYMSVFLMGMAWLIMKVVFYALVYYRIVGLFSADTVLFYTCDLNAVKQSHT